MIHSSKILKLKARTSLMGKYSYAVSIMVTMTLLSALLSWLLDLSGFSLNGDMTQKICFMIMNVVILLLEGLLGIGLSYFFLQMATNQTISKKMLFFCFTHDPDRFLLALAFRGGISLLGWLPALISFYRFPNLWEATPRHIIALLLLAIFGLIIHLLVRLFLGQSYYILLENPECSILGSMKQSIVLMRGHKIRYLRLMLSLIAYPLLELGSMGIGTFFIQPYLEMIHLQFYFNLTGRDPLEEAKQAREKEEEPLHVWPQEPGES